MRPTTAFGLVAFTLTFVAATPLPANPARELEAALRHFLKQPNYTWTASQTRGLPEQDGGNEPVNPSPKSRNLFGPEGWDIAGQHDKTGFTKVYLVAAAVIPPEERPLKKPWVAISDEAVINRLGHLVSARWVFLTPSGWKSLAEIPRYGPLLRGKFRVDPPPNIYRGKLVPLRWVLPHQDLQIVADNLSVVKRNGNEFRAELLPVGAARLMAPTTRFPHWDQFSPVNKDPAATITCWLRDGELIGYELAVSVATKLVGADGAPLRTSFTIVRYFQDVGTTVIEVPDEARALLGR